MAETSTSVTLKQGFLDTYSNRCWNRRWVIIIDDDKDTSCFIYDDQKCEELLHVIPLNSAKLLDYQSSASPTWALANECFLCNNPFTFFNRRHHCRYCGKSVCDKESKQSILVPQFGYVEPVRVCDACFPVVENELNRMHLSSLTRNAIHYPPLPSEKPVISLTNSSSITSSIIEAGDSETTTPKLLLSNSISEKYRQFHPPVPMELNSFALKTVEQEIWFKDASFTVMKQWTAELRAAIGRYQTQYDDTINEMPNSHNNLNSSSGTFPAKEIEEMVHNRGRISSTVLSAQEVKDISQPKNPQFSFTIGERIAFLDEKTETFIAGTIVKKVFDGSKPTNNFEVELEPNCFVILPASKLYKFTRSKISWEKGKLIGKGAHGKVYEGLNLLNGQRIAIKQMRLGIADDKSSTLIENEISELSPEISLMQALSHPNLVKLLGFEVHSKKKLLYILMEYVSGGSIRALLNDYGAFPEPMIVEYTKQLLNGLDYLHDNGVVHRDLNGGNVLISTSGVIKIADLGISKRLMDHLLSDQQKMMERKKSNLKTMIGTPHFMAPEVVMEDGYGRKADVWGLGCTVIQMATSKSPWPELTPISALYAIGEGGSTPDFPYNLSPLCKDFLTKCLVRDKEQRASIKELLNHPWLLPENVPKLISTSQGRSRKSTVKSKDSAGRKKNSNNKLALP